MAYISFQPSDFFNTVLYTGNASDRTISGVGFQPDWVWIKNRSASYNHGLFDSNRGANLRLSSSTNGSEVTYTESLTAFNSDGFDLGDNSDGNNTVNNNSENYVAWNWLSNGGTTSSNSDGSITSTVQANTTAGFSVVTWTGTGANATVGHGLGVAPKMIINKNRSLGTGDWVTYHNSIGATKFLQLNSTSATGTSIIAFNNTEPTSSVFSVGTWDSANGNGNNMISYVFADVKGYSKFGSYTGNGSADGTFVYTGFRPAFVLTKRTDSAQNWAMYDNRRNDDAPAGANVIDRLLYPNASDAEVDTGGSLMVDFLSNGFKWRGTSSITNNGASIYMAFAEFPLVGSNGLAGTAR